jgi:hypothetical protein
MLIIAALAMGTGLAGCNSNDASVGGTPPPVTSGTPPPGSSSGVATLSWAAPTENTDGSVLQNLSGYVIHYGLSTDDMTSTITIANPGITTYVVDNLPAGTYFFSLSATTSSGIQSSPSNVATATIS